jgi:hypothetical protein
MMVGGGLMLLFGLLVMLIVIGLPILLVVAAVAGVWGLSGRRAGSAPSSQGAVRTVGAALSFTRFCSHCGQGLQADWTHCPQCGAPS